jgi:exosortase D (VPLPA-CTERM-specific)
MSRAVLERIPPALRTRSVPLALILLAFTVVYAPLLGTLLVDCWNDDNYSYALLVPLVAGFLAYRRRHDPVQLSPRATTTLRVMAWGFLLGGGALFVIGAAAAEQFTTRLSGVLIGTGLVGVFCGPASLRRYAPPLLLLTCMIPWPYTFYYQATFPLQLFSARVASGSMDAMGFEVVRWGNIFEVNGHALEVVRACSGLRSMMTLGTLALALALFTRLSWWRGVLLVLSSAPLAMFGNSLRLIVTSLLVVAFGPNAAEGLAHDSVGIVTFVVSVVLLAGLSKLLRRSLPEGVEPTSAPSSPSAFTPRRLAAWSAAACVLACGAYGSWMRVHSVEPTDTTQLSRFPRQLLGLGATDVPIEPRVLEQVGADDLVFRVYEDGKTPEVGLYIGYYRSQRQGAQIHSPQHCYPGAGWEVQESEPILVRRLDGGFDELRRLVVERDGRRDVVVYWYDTRTGRLSDDIGLKLNLMRTALLRLPQDAAFVRWSTPIAEHESLDAATRRLLVVAAHALPHLQEVLPFEG